MARPAASDQAAQRARCPECGADVVVRDLYGHGDVMECSNCSTGLKVHRKSGLRLVIADLGPLRDALREHRQRVAAVEAELQDARGSLGVGANGLGIGLLYVVYQVGQNDQDISRPLLVTALGVAVLSGLVLEVANYLFLAKRQKMNALATELAEVRQIVRNTERKIKDSNVKF